eukprot:CAMPEP_0171323620 /NCGR_PEP_ID=MMETSP0816-20121228/115684_1 /TAXON_ID=420281 /ORGANISM="Proboscia inermis, Strain CCAP1064/1" /LENGTH=51 /DNA_ID=CAMNT_0011822371 /DNA_START=1419 /DNA_END=1571 /DNA_ORIENTATION=+
MTFEDGDVVTTSITTSLENDESSFNLAMPLLVFANMSLLMFHFWSGSLSVW